MTPELSLPRDAAGMAGRKQERGRGAPASLANRSACPVQGLCVLPPPPHGRAGQCQAGGPQGLQPRCLQALLVHPTALSSVSIVTLCHPHGARAEFGDRGQHPRAACVVWQSEQTRSWGLRSGPFGALDAHAAPFPIPWAVTGTTSPGLGGSTHHGTARKVPWPCVPTQVSRGSLAWLFQLPAAVLPAPRARSQPLSPPYQ